MFYYSCLTKIDNVVVSDSVRRRLCGLMHQKNDNIIPLSNSIKQNNGGTV